MISNKTKINIQFVAWHLYSIRFSSQQQVSAMRIRAIELISFIYMQVICLDINKLVSVRIQNVSSKMRICGIWMQHTIMQIY